ncbi:MAG TPA: 2-dehydropantoate 2-reductase [Thermoplasmata archaeon]|jgi:2-dehydropantoate 2-reductase
MRVCVFGAGSLGSAIGGLLSAKNEVVLVGRRPHVLAVRRNGLEMRGDVRRRVVVDARENVDGLPSPDLLLIATKAYDTKNAVSICRRWAGESTMVLTLQNGLGNLEILREWKKSRAYGGTTTLGANLTEPGVVRLSGLGKTVIGSDLDEQNAAWLARNFSSSGIPTTVSRDIGREIWEKAVVSASINPTTAILRIRSGRLLESDFTRRFIEEVALESVRVAVAHGLPLRSKEVLSRIRAVAKDTAGNRSSMLQDVERGRKTEISMINGSIARTALLEGVAAPLNSALTVIVEELERQTAHGKG